MDPVPMIACLCCGKSISAKAVACPHCGHPKPAPTEPDRDSCLAALSKDAERSRGTLYLLVLSVVASITLFRTSVSPDWLEARANKYEQAFRCAAEHRSDPECVAAIQYVKQRGIDVREIPTANPSDWRFKEYRSLVEYYRKKRIDLRVVQIPILSLSIDINDLWIWTGLLQVFILLVLHSLFVREREDLELACRIGVPPETRRTTQLLTTSPYRTAIAALFFVPAAVQAFWVVGRWFSRNDDYAFAKHSSAWILVDFAAMGLCLVFLAVLAVQTARAWLDLGRAASSS